LENGLPADISGTYDVIILSHVLEHICYPSKLLNDLKRVMHPGSRLIIALPNIMHYQSRIQLMLGNFNYREAGVWDYTHFRWYTFNTARKLLLDHGFTVEYAGVAGDLPFGRITKRIFPAAVQKFLYRVLTSISKGLFGSQLLLAGKLASNPAKHS
jgi:SAM-dependent methyltransferase